MRSGIGDLRRELDGGVRVRWVCWKGCMYAVLRCYFICCRVVVEDR